MENTITNKCKKAYSAGEKAALLAAYKASGPSNMFQIYFLSLAEVALRRGLFC